MSEQPQVALIVGGSGDIGRAVCRKLGELGYRILLTGRTQERVTEAAEELQRAGIDARGVVCDLNDDASIAKVFDELGTAFGRLDALVNAAGVSEPRLLVRADRSHLEATFGVNVVGPALVAGRALTLMRKSGRGLIVNIASMAAVEGKKGFGAYGASKGALVAMAESLREEAARFGVRVATICPDRVDTRMHGDNPDRAKMIPPKDVAETVAYLLRLSPEAEVHQVWIRNLTSGKTDS
jgi:3-oxoacyl-[acyl-carrier protein] reductase